MSACCMDYDAPAVYNETWQTARKQHECYECGGTIQPGDEYQNIRGLWEGEWFGAATCEKCADLRLSLSVEWCTELGNLRNNYREYLWETGKARYDEVLDRNVYPINHLIPDGV